MKSIFPGRYRLTVLLLVLVAGLSSCRKEPSSNTFSSSDREYQNFFGYSVMETYYRWNKQIETDLNKWKESDLSRIDPIDKVKEIRYKKNGKDYDRWTMMTDDYKSSLGNLTGISMTYGFDFVLYWYDQSRRNLAMVVTVVYEDSPAEKAGIRRGDIILRVKSKTLDADNYYKILNEDFLQSASTKLTLSNGETITMEAVDMYENPVLCTRVFDIGTKKVGYLAYNSFTLRSIGQLAKECKDFREQGVSELVLDLRYNGGGYVTAEVALASMIAPRIAVETEQLYEKDIYNYELTQALIDRYGEDGTSTFLETTTTYADEGTIRTINTLASNMDIKKVYALVSDKTASASEALLVCLEPFLDIDIIGQQTYGKFCGGNLISSEDWAEYFTDKQEGEQFAEATKNWGIYVMTSTYQDRNGNNPAIPDGLAPDCLAEDDPLSGHQLGDENEPMLKLALQRAGKVYNRISEETISRTSLGERFPEEVHKAGFGLRVNSRLP